MANISWRPLTLSEARGFVIFYSIAYTPTPNIRRRQAPQDTVYINANAQASSVMIAGLDGDLAYTVAMSASTIAGTGIQSDAVELSVVFATDSMQCKTLKSSNSVLVSNFSLLQVSVIPLLIILGQ